MQIDQMEGFLKDIWGMQLGNWAKNYYRAIDAYNTSYSGVKIDDFIDCWMLFDMLGVAQVLAKRAPRPYSFNENPGKQASVGHSELIKELIAEAMSYYSNNSNALG